MSSDEKQVIYLLENTIKHVMVYVILTNGRCQDLGFVSYTTDTTIHFLSQ